MKADLTGPVEAGARAAYELDRARLQGILPLKQGAALPEWENLQPVQKGYWRNHILPVVQAAINAIPEPSGPGSNAWLQALMGGPGETD